MSLPVKRLPKHFLPVSLMFLAYRLDLEFLLDFNRNEEIKSFPFLVLFLILLSMSLCHPNPLYVLFPLHPIYVLIPGNYAARNVNLCKHFVKKSDISFYCWTSISSMTQQLYKYSRTHTRMFLVELFTVAEM